MRYLAGYANFCRIFDTGTQLSDVHVRDIRSYWTDVHQILHDVVTALPLLTCSSALRYSNPFRNATATSKLCRFALKLFVMATAVDRSEEEVGSIFFYEQIPTNGENFVEIGPVDSEISLQ